MRESKGWTQEQLAEQAGLDRSFLADLEGARHSCAVDRLFDLATALGVTAASLLEGA
jgi:transcriptional regulator with XRE-family HTH domain